MVIQSGHNMTDAAKVVVTRHERKDRLGHGGIKEVAELAGVDASLVSRVVNGKRRHARIEAIITGRIGRPGEVVFPPREAPTRRKPEAATAGA